MIKIDGSLLEEIGLATLPPQEKDGLLKHIYETLEMRVGMRLADQMTNQQLDEFEQYFEAKDDAGAFKWLETNFPNYKDIVQEEFDKLKAEVAQSAPQILSASQTQPPVQVAPQNPTPVSDNVQPVAPSHQYQPAPVGPAGPYVPQAPQQSYPQQQPPAGPAPQQPPYQG